MSLRFPQFLRHRLSMYPDSLGARTLLIASGVIAILWLTLFAASTLLIFPYRIALIAITFCSAAVLTIRATHTTGIVAQARRGWHLVGVWALLCVLTILLQSEQQFLLIHTVGISPADLIQLIADGVLLLAILAFPRVPERIRDPITFWLDLTVVLLGSGLLIWYVVVSPALWARYGAIVDQMILLVHVVLAAAGLFLITQLSFRKRNLGSKLVVYMLFSGILIALITELLVVQQHASGTAQRAIWIDALLISAAILVGAAAYLERSTPLEQRLPPPTKRGLILLPYLALIGAYILLFSVAFGTAQQPFQDLLIGAFLVTALVVVRQFIALRQHARLLRDSVQLTTELRMSAARFRSLVQNASDGIAVIDAAGKLIYQSPSSRRILGYDPAIWLGQSIEVLVHPEDVAQLRAARQGIAAVRGLTITLEIRVRHADQSWRWIEVSLTNLQHEPSVLGMVANYHDITDRRSLVARLWQQANHDSLTMLANRSRFQERLDTALALHGGCAILILDLDGFKTINDSMGHATGDRVLIVVAERLRNAVREGDLVARLGGDEFAVLVEGQPALELAQRVAERVLTVLREPIVIDGKHLFAYSSIGIAATIPEAVDGAALLQNADTAMYSAKRSGKGRMAVFNPSMHRAAVEQLEIEIDLQQALDQNEFTLFYQPIIHTRTNQCCGFEALLRWEHPRLGLLTPDRFIRLLEESGQISVLGDRMLREACLAAAGWHSHEHPLFVSVNLSIRQMMQTTLIDVVQRALAESGLPAACLKLEITESSSFYDVAGAVEVFAALKQLGVAIAFDDFGMGHSALSYLTSFPIDLLKIDRTFVATLGASEYDSRLARALIALATTLGLTMIAEGVETQEQVLALQQLGCELCQGYFFAPPLSMEEAVQFLGARE